MSALRAALLALCLVGTGLVAAAAPTGAVGVEADSRPVLLAANGTDNGSLGADITSFMQSRAAETGEAIETGMWTAEYDATENRSVRARLVERRTAELREDLGVLRQRKAALVAEREAGNVSETTYKAKVSRLFGEIRALESALNATEPRAREVGVGVESLETIRSGTENLTGPEIAAVARNLTGVGPERGGPPAGVGLNDDVGRENVTTAGNATDGEAGVLDGTSANATTGEPNEDGGVPVVAGRAGGEAAVGPPNGTGPAGVPGNGTDGPGAVAFEVAVPPDANSGLADLPVVGPPSGT